MIREGTDRKNRTRFPATRRRSRAAFRDPERKRDAGHPFRCGPSPAVLRGGSGRRSHPTSAARDPCLTAPFAVLPWGCRRENGRSACPAPQGDPRERAHWALQAAATRQETAAGTAGTLRIGARRPALTPSAGWHGPFCRPSVAARTATDARTGAPSRDQRRFFPQTALREHDIHIALGI